MAWEPLILSLRVALIATLCCATIGIALGALLAWKKTPARDFLDALLSTPLVLPPTVVGYYLLTVLGRESAIGQAWKAVFGHQIVFTVTGCVVAATVGSMPLMVKAARTAIEEVDPTLRAAARTLGAGPVRVFFTVTLPLAAPGLLAGGMLAFARALGDFGITLMIAGDMPGQTQTASLYIYDQVQAGRDSRAALMSAILTAVAVAILYTVNRLTRRRGG
jgi:molybdate transport system permease protein